MKYFLLPFKTDYF